MSLLRASLLVATAVVAGPVLGASPDPKSLVISPAELSKAKELVKKLGSDDYRGREDAQAELAKMGRTARPALVEAATTETDPEIRARSLRLLPKAESEDLKARVETFLEDKDGKFDHNLPGLKAFRDGVGTNAKARELYVEILKSPYNLDMFAAMDRGDEEGGRAVSDRRNTLYGDMIHRNFVGGRQPTPPKQPTLADVAAVLFAESRIPSEHIPRTTIQWQQVSGVLLLNQSSASMQAINGNGTHSEAYKVIIGKWLANRSDPRDLEQLVYQIGPGGNLRNFPESAPLLRRIVVHDAVQGYMKGQALMYMLQQRSDKETQFLKAIVRNEVRVGDYPELFKKGEDPEKRMPLGADAMITQVGFQNNKNPNGQDIHQVTLRDVALAFLITQSGQKMREYGFETPPYQNFEPNPQSFGQYAFTSEEKRVAAFVKYGWYQLKQNVKDKEPVMRREGELPPGLMPPTGGGTGPAPTPKPQPRPLPPVRDLPRLPQVAPALPPANDLPLAQPLPLVKPGK